MDADADDVSKGGARPVVEWSRLEPILDAVLDVDPSRRAALLAELTHDDAALRAALRRLLEGDARPHPLLDHSLVDSFASLLEDDLVPFPPSLAARYRGATEIGRGGMAVVFRARDIKHDRDVAVKVVRPEMAASLGRDRFLQEIQVVAGLRHPHIIPLFDSGEADNTLYFVMPYEEGHSLRERLVGGGPLPIAETLVIVRDVCEALAYAHRCGVVHRDIKPENILLSGGHALIADFGIASARPSASASHASVAGGRVIGTLAYMSPEQRTASQAVDERTDIYAVGVVAYELLAGRRPFEARSDDDRQATHHMNTPIDLVAYRDDIPPQLSQAIARCLRQRQEDRWQSADQMLHELPEIIERPVPAARLPAASLPAASLSARALLPLAVGIAAVALLGVVAWLTLRTRNTGWQNPLANARIERLTDFAGAEVDATISPDGRFVAFLAESSGVFDAYVTQLGSGRFHNLTAGALPELFNEDVRNISFSANSSEIWLRSAGINAIPSVSRMPTMGGPLRPFLDRAVMSVASPDGARIAYHEGGDDPIFVADAQGMSPRLIFSSATGQHSHYLTWSPDGLFIYFAYGQPLDKMDIWRVPADSGSPTRITRHESKVSYPLLLDARTLLYVATDEDGTGPWLYAMDLDARVARRLSSGVEHTLSLAAAAPVAGQARRIVTTVANPSVTLWSIPLSGTVADEQVATPIAQVTTARARGPRYAPDGTLYYLTSRSGADGLWTLRKNVATERWSASAGAVVGAPAISPDGATVCAPVRQNHRSSLRCTSVEGTQGRELTPALDVRGAPSWSPDGKWIAIAAQDSIGVRIWKVPADGGTPINLVPTVSSAPVWSPDGRFILYSGAPRARSVPMQAVTPEGQPFEVPALTVDRLGDSYRFVPGSAQLIVKQGGFRRQDLYRFDLGTGQLQRVTRLRGGESLLRFDVSPDGQRVIFERVRENSDVVLLELPP